MYEYYTEKKVSSRYPAKQIVSPRTFSYLLRCLQLLAGNLQSLEKTFDFLQYHLLGSAVAVIHSSAESAKCHLTQLHIYSCFTPDTRSCDMSGMKLGCSCWLVTLLSEQPQFNHSSQNSRYRSGIFFLVRVKF